MDIMALLYLAKANGASDLHLVASSPPLLRICGSLQAIDSMTPLTADDINQAFNKLTTLEEREEFRQKLELDFAYTLPEVGHLRCNAAQQRGAISLAVRLLPPKVPTIDELELPPICKELALKKRGLVIVTGPTGSGKTTTLAAMINHLNINQRRHLVTLEDPIEYLHPSLNCAITQRQLGTDTLSFADALKHILRQDPDVIFGR